MESSRGSPLETFARGRPRALARTAGAGLGLACAAPLAVALLVVARGDLGPVAPAAEVTLEALALAALLGAAVLAKGLGLAHESARRRIRRLRGALARSRRETRLACARLGRLDETRRRLVAAVSHELRTPLTAAGGYAAMLASGRLGPLEPRQERAVAVVARAIARETSVVENLIAFARLDGASYRPERAVLDLREPVRAAHDDLRDLARRRGVSLELDLPREPVPVEADAAGLRLVVANLVSNAVQMTPRGGSAVVRAVPEDGRARVSVSDTGPGVSRDDVPRIFEPFFQAHGGDTREKGGAGIGLAIVKGVLEAHGASVALDEPPGGGARFTFALPLASAGVPSLAA